MNDGRTSETIRVRLSEAGAEAREIGAEVGEIAGELRLLAMKEVELAQAEMMQQVQRAIRGLVLGLAAALLGVLMLTFLFLGLMFGLDTVLPLWTAALITAGLLLLLVGAAAWFAMSQVKQIYLVPRRFMRSVREDMTWLRSRMTWSGR
jgi:hypothetical protein